MGSRRCNARQPHHAAIARTRAVRAVAYTRRREVAGRAVSLTGQAIQVVTPGDREPRSVTRRRHRRPPAGRDAAPPVADAPTRAVAHRSHPARCDPLRSAASRRLPSSGSKSRRRRWSRSRLTSPKSQSSFRSTPSPASRRARARGVTVIEPWEGYRPDERQRRDRPGQDAGVAELATMRVYEARHRARQTVLAAVDRQLKLANGGRLA